MTQKRRGRGKDRFTEEQQRNISTANMTFSRKGIVRKYRQKTGEKKKQGKKRSSKRENGKRKGGGRGGKGNGNGKKERIKAESWARMYVRAHSSIINVPWTIVFLSATSMPINRSSVSHRVESIDPRHEYRVHRRLGGCLPVFN